MNDDGSLDIVVVNKGSEDIDVLLGEGDGTFPADDTPIPTFGVPGDIAIGQMDTDDEWQYPRFLAFTEGDTLALAPPSNWRTSIPTAAPPLARRSSSTIPAAPAGCRATCSRRTRLASTPRGPMTPAVPRSRPDRATTRWKTTRRSCAPSPSPPRRPGRFGGRPRQLPADPRHRHDGRRRQEGRRRRLSAPIFVKVIATGAQDDAFAIWENRTLGARRKPVRRQW